MVLGACRDAGAIDVPPIPYTGEFVTTVRVDVPEDSGKIYRFGSSAILGANTYLWQPWFSTVDGEVNLSQLRTYSAEDSVLGGADSSATLASGRLNLNVFPRSRFPFTAFVNLQDNRQEFDSRFVEQRDRRLLRYGVTQRYTPLGGNSRYNLRLERREDSSDSGGLNLDQTSNEAELTTSHRFDKHNVTTRLNLQQTDQQQQGASFTNAVATVQHGYQASESLTIQNFASAASTSSDVSTGLAAGAGSVDTTSLQLSSFATWNPRDSDLSVDGDVLFSSDQVDLARQSTSRTTSRANLTARYEWTPSVRVTGNLSGGIDGGDTTSNFTSQSLTVGYSPPARELGVFQYVHSASASASNNTSSIASATRNLSSAFSHGLSRVMPMGADGAFTLSGSVDQSLGLSYDSPGGNDTSLLHAASLGVAHAGVSSSTRAVLDIQDSRQLGSSDTVSIGGSEVQTANLQAQHNSRFGRFASLSASANVAWTRTSFENGGSTSFPSSFVSVSYRHGRLFGVRRLVFTSELSSTSASLTFIGGGSEDLVAETTFENHLFYTIGRVSAELEFTMIRSRDLIDSFVFFSLTRRIAGVL